MISESSESDSAREILLAGLAEWIRLLKLPAGGNYGVQKLEHIQAEVRKDTSQIRPLLLSGNIWGGMGSFLDSAVPRYESGIPEASDPIERAKQWEDTHRVMDHWHREFSIATIQVGKALIDWCRDNGGISRNGQRTIEVWIDSAKRYLEAPYRPLEPVNIECLEHNMRFDTEVKLAKEKLVGANTLGDVEKALGKPDEIVGGQKGSKTKYIYKSVSKALKVIVQERHDGKIMVSYEAKEK